MRIYSGKVVIVEEWCIGFIFEIFWKYISECDSWVIGHGDFELFTEEVYYCLHVEVLIVVVKYVDGGFGCFGVADYY